jgi:hypothetical protein
MGEAIVIGTASTTISEFYRPKHSWHNFVTSNARFFGELLYAPQAITPIALLLLRAAVFIYAFLRRDRMLRLMAFWIVIVPLPIAFIFRFAVADVFTSFLFRLVNDLCESFM